MSIDFEPGETAGSPGLTINVSQATFDRWRASGTWVQFARGRADLATFSTHGGVLLPPADWAAQECETCGGRGWYWGAKWRIACKAPDCNGNRRLPVDLPCEECDGGSDLWRSCEADDGMDEDHECSQCVDEPCPSCNVGRITVAWATVEWGPLEVVEALMTAPPPTDAIEVTPGGGVVLRRCTNHFTWESWTYTTLPLPPDIDLREAGSVSRGANDASTSFDPASLVGLWAIGGRIEVAG